MNDSPERPGGATDPPAGEPWSDPGRRSKVAVAALAVVLYLLVVDVLWRVVGVVTVGGLVAVSSELWFDQYDLVSTVLDWTYLGSLAAAALTFIRWQRTMIRNLRPLGCERPDHGAGFAIVAWFIPVANLVVPLASLLEVARWSRPPRARPAGALLGWWWGLWVVSSITLSTASLIYRVGTTATAWIAAATVDAVGALLLIGAGVLAVKVIRTLTSWQLVLSPGRGDHPSVGERQCYHDRDEVAGSAHRHATI